jgi:glycogen synthase
LEERAISRSSLSRFRLQDEHLITDALVRAELSSAFGENRCFSFYPDPGVIDRLRAGDPPALFRERFLAIRARMVDVIAGSDGTVRARLESDLRLASRIVSGLSFVHEALARIDSPSLPLRRFVLVRERRGIPTMYHVSRETTVIAHIGQGPEWEEIPTVYFGLNIIDALNLELKAGKTGLFDAFVRLIAIEGRAIETGYAHVDTFSPGDARLLAMLVDEVIRASSLAELAYKAVVPGRKVKRFSAREREKILALLDRRIEGDVLNFDYAACIEGTDLLEKHARTYKRGDDPASLREIVRLLVAASGHDIHEVRNRANMLLERVLAPKEFDAPLATSFVNVSAGMEHRFEFDLGSGKNRYFVRLYRSRAEEGLNLERDLDFEDLALVPDGAGKRHSCVYVFPRCGHYDYVVFEKRGAKGNWLHGQGTSGRVNVIPDVRGEIILEIFPDIHGHTKVYWMDGSGHPGLVYNEHGEVIRLGRFSDITAHLDDLKKRYSLTALYLLGVQRRGNNREDWAPEATSPSPFSPMSLVEIEPSLGGDEEFRELVSEAHRRGIRIIVDIIPHLNRRSQVLPDSMVVQCYDGDGKLVLRASTDGRFGSWNDGRLYNYRMFEVWEWLAGSVNDLIDRFDIDGIRFDSAHAVPIMMKKNNYPAIYDKPRGPEEAVEGTIIVNEREDGHFITTGFYDCACRDILAVPLHYYLALAIERKMRERNKEFFVNIAECYWGHERYLTRTGIIPYNSALFKICENIIHGKTDVREIYHVYDSYFPSSLPKGTELLGILGNHDERRALNTFGHRGLRAAVGITMFMSNMIMDYEGSAEGESWKVYLDNIFVNWNQFEYVAHRSVDKFYGEWYEFHRSEAGAGYMVWANNNTVAAAVKFTPSGTWIGVFNFADTNQPASIQFDNPALPIPGDAYYRIIDPVYSPITGHYSYFTGRELRNSRINTTVSFTDRVKLLKLEVMDGADIDYHAFLRDSFYRLCEITRQEHFAESFAYCELKSRAGSFGRFTAYLSEHLEGLLPAENVNLFELGIKRALFHLVRNGVLESQKALDYIARLSVSRSVFLRDLGVSLKFHNSTDSLIFISAEADPFSKSGGLANVVYELPRELAGLGESVYVITGFYKNGDDKSIRKMWDAVQKYNVEYTGKNVFFQIMDTRYEVGVYRCTVEGVTYFLLDHYEFFDGLYWGVTAEEKLRRRIALARASAEVIATFGLRPLFTFTNDAYAGIFNGIVRSDHVYIGNPNFSRTTFLHIIHNGGWQYFDAYARYENGFDLFQLFNLPAWKAGDFSDPSAPDRINCMASGIRFADRVITVSPSYARQIEYACDGLERILSNVIGISNAIGRDFRNRLHRSFEGSGFVRQLYPKLREAIDASPGLRGKVAARYPEILAGPDAAGSVADPARREVVERAMRKMMLQAQRGLRVDPDIVLFTMIHRITEQKGFNLLLESSEGIFKNLGFQAIIGGAISSGDRRGEEIAHGLYLLSQYYKDSVSTAFGFQEIRPHSASRRSALPCWGPTCSACLQ